MPNSRKYRVNYLRFSIFILVCVLVLSAVIAGTVFLVRRHAQRARVEPIASLTPQSTPAPVISQPDPDAQATPAPTDTPDSVTINIRAVGDIAVQTGILDGCYDSTSNSYDFTSVFAQIAPMLQSDLTIASFESVCVDPSVAAYSGSRVYNTPISFIDAMAQAGIDAVTLANSHILDQGMAGIEQTTQALDEAGISHFGAYATQELADSDQAMLLDVQGIKVAVLSYTGEVRGNSSKLTAQQQEYAVNMIDEAAILDQILRVKERGAEVVIVCLHWGELFTRDPSDSMRSMAENILLAGADVILGSHTQQVQPVTDKMVSVGGSEKRGIVAYCLGNFLSQDRDPYNDSGMILSLDITKDLTTGEVTVAAPSYLPTWIDQYDAQTGKAYQILPMADYQSQKGSLSENAWMRIKAAYSEVTGKVGDSVALLEK